MEDWVTRALARWPDVPAVHGWLSLDRRGRWRIRGELISRPQIIDTFNANYGVDDRGGWYFQNGPQRGYMTLDYAPLVLMRDGDSETLRTHTGNAVDDIQRAFMDEEGSLLLVTEHGPGLLIDTDLDWALGRIESAGRPIGDRELSTALDLPSGAPTDLVLRTGSRRLRLVRLDAADAPERLGFLRDPSPA